jgi:hypothetical protein
METGIFYFPAIQKEGVKIEILIKQTILLPKVVNQLGSLVVISREFHLPRKSSA